MIAVYYVLLDGTEMVSYDVGDDIRGGICADLNDDGSYKLVFTGYDDMIHVWNPMNCGVRWVASGYGI